MHDRFLSLTAESPDSAALIDGATGRITTRAGLLARADEIRSQLTGAGLRSGDVLAVQLPNSVDFVAAWLAVLKLGLVMAPVDRDAPETEVGSILGHFGIKGLLYRPDRTSPSIAITTRPGTHRPPVPRDARLVKLTSGSTGKPK